MANQVLSQIEELLNEEKWTRATIENYSKKNFIKLDNLIESALSEGEDSELKELCIEHLAHSPNSIISLYITGILNYEHKALDHSTMSKAISLFRDNRKWSIVEFLAERVLAYEENKRALKALAAAYQNLHMDDELWRIWERLIKVDHSNSSIAKKIAVHYEEEENFDLAIYYYKITLKRLLMQNELSQVDEIWRKLIQLASEDLDFFFSMESKMQEKLNEETLGNAYMELLTPYEGVDLDTSIKILELVIKYAPNNSDARKKLEETLKQKYADHSRLEETLTIASISQTWKPIEEALEFFYKNISLDTGDYVFHRSWKIGTITHIEADTYTIDFDDKKGHSMELDMAIKSLTKLEKEHLWVIAREDKEGLKKMAIENPEEFLRITLNSFGKEMVLKEMKAEIINSGALPASKWTSWWNKSKKIFKTNPKFGTSPDKKNIYFLRDKPMSFDEDSLNRFESEKDFAKKLLIFEDYINHTTDYTNGAFHKMLTYFIAQSKEKTEEGLSSATVESILFLLRLKKQLEARGTSSNIELPRPVDFYKQLTDPAETLKGLVELENKKALIQLIRKNDQSWDTIYASILEQQPAQYHSKLLEELMLNDKDEIINKLFKSILDHYREDVDHLIWLTKIFFDREGDTDAIQLDATAIYIALLNSLARLDKDIQNKTNVGTNRKRFNTIQDLLFKENKLPDFIESNSTDTVNKLVSVLPLVLDILDEDNKQYVMLAIKEKHPQIEIVSQESKQETEKIHPFLVTQKSYDIKQAEYKHIVEVDIPENSKDIALAVEKGDLSENAEYKAALEHQEQLKAKVSQLDSELKMAKIISDHDITLDHIGFANKVTLLNASTKENEVLTILGEWDSDPAKKIISYKSPLGNAMLFKKVDDQFSLNLGDKEISYKVLEIEKADF